MGEAGERATAVKQVITATCSGNQSHLGPSLMDESWEPTFLVAALGRGSSQAPWPSLSTPGLSPRQVPCGNKRGNYDISIQIFKQSEEKKNPMRNQIRNIHWWKLKLHGGRTNKTGLFQSGFSCCHSHESRTTQREVVSRTNESNLVEC